MSLVRNDRLFSNSLHWLAAARSVAKLSSWSNIYPPEESQKSLLLLEKVPPAGGGCGGDTYNKCQSG